MQKLAASIFAILVGIAALGLTPSSTRAALLQVDGGGQLTGAQNVDVLGTLFDMTFVDGTCIALFSGCDEVADFDFTDQATALAAAQALLDQVFIDTALGLFDTDPELTSGCSEFGSCNTIIPYGFDVPDAATALAINGAPGASPDQLSLASVLTAGDTTVEPRLNYAIFRRPTATIPEPSTLLLFGVVLSGLAGFGWRRRRV